jgi:alpha-amylase/alpha-mannosidase (GH57 family)
VDCSIILKLFLRKYDLSVQTGFTAQDRGKWLTAVNTVMNFTELSSPAAEGMISGVS